MKKRFWRSLILGGWFATGAVFTAAAMKGEAEAAHRPLSIASQGHGDELGLSPFWDWKTIESDHFRVTFPKELELTARRSAAYLEEAHLLLSGLMHWEPRYRVQVVVVDNADMANGLAAAVARFGMVLFATPPDNWFSTAYYEDWLRLLVIHEYTHILNMDVTRGLYDGLRVIFGDAALPNSIWPTWMLEGLAVYLETRMTGGGRGRSPYYEMILRAAVERDLLNNPSYITLDKVNGPNPLPPGGETPYLFGYQLMNQVARDASRGGDDALGVMSQRSAGRIPFFINGNLENVTGKSWYDYWKQFVGETQVRQNRALEQIRAISLTDTTPLTSGVTVQGVAASPDGKWLAYNQESPDERSGLYLRDLTTGNSRKLFDKTAGVGLAFTPDSKSIVFSAVHKKPFKYELFSDLSLYELSSGVRTQLSDRQRLRDPDISPDAETLVFTRAVDSRVELASARLENSANGWKLGKVESIFTPARYERVSNPKFSPDGRRVVFSLHRQGKTGEDLMEIQLAVKSVSTLVTDGHYNRFPTFDSQGALFFVSDATGVDNLYRWVEGRAISERLTNVTTGLWFPAFSPDGKVYASVYSPQGWDLARVAPSSVSFSPQAIAPIPAPEPVAPAMSGSEIEEKAASFSVRDYSIFPSIWPRIWVPTVFATQDGVSASAQVTGFDAVDRHRYTLGAGYDSELGKGDFSAVYSNRSWGPTISLAGSLSSVSLTDVSFGRETEVSASVSYPIEWTYSSLVPALSFNAERTFFYSRANEAVLAKTVFVPSVDASLSFSNIESSRLAISPERGRISELGARLYQDGDARTWKAFASNTEHFKLPGHQVLVPSIRAAYASRSSFTFTDSNVVVEGTRGNIFDSERDGFDQLVLRGYSGVRFVSRAAAVGSLEYRAPLWRIRRGWGTNPFFAENLWGFVFGESAYFPRSVPEGRFLPAAGLGLRLTGKVFIHLPLILALQAHQGYAKEQGGKNELLIGIGLGEIAF